METPLMPTALAVSLLVILFAMLAVSLGMVCLEVIHAVRQFLGMEPNP